MLKQQCRCCGNSWAHEHGEWPDIRITAAANVAQERPLLPRRALADLRNVDHFSFRLKESRRKSFLTVLREHAQCLQGVLDDPAVFMKHVPELLREHTPRMSNWTLPYRTHTDRALKTQRLGVHLLLRIRCMKDTFVNSQFNTEWFRGVTIWCMWYNMI